MATELTVDGTVFDYPTPGGRVWGEDATGWAEAVTRVLGTLAPAGFIPETTSTINDNISIFTNITGALFDSGLTRSFTLLYSVVRTNGSTQSNENGTITGHFSNSIWDFSIDATGNSGLEFNMTNGGQLQYKSSSIGGTYSGSIKFNAITIAI